MWGAAAAKKSYISSLNKERRKKNLYLYALHMCERYIKKHKNACVCMTVSSCFFFFFIILKRNVICEEDNEALKMCIYAI